MTNDQTIYLTVGDTIDLTGTVSADLTGATLRIHTRRPDGTVVERDGTVVDPTSGAWSSTYAIGDLTQPGWCSVEVQVTFSDNRIQTFKRDTADQLVGFITDSQYA